MVYVTPQVSSHGRIRSAFGVVTYGYKQWEGYMITGVFKKTQNVHRLVARAFLGPIPPDHTVQHNNQQRDDNHKDNTDDAACSRKREAAASRPRQVLYGETVKTIFGAI